MLANFGEVGVKIQVFQLISRSLKYFDLGNEAEKVQIISYCWCDLNTIQHYLAYQDQDLRGQTAIFLFIFSRMKLNISIVTH